MGSIVSSLMGGGAADASDSTLEGSGVKVFHSSERWSLHFNDSKESNQLVSLTLISVSLFFLIFFIIWGFDV